MRSAKSQCAARRRKGHLLNSIKLVIWDWNGTLLNDVEVCYHTINELLCRHGYAPLTGLADYRSKFCFPIVQYYRNVGIDFDRTPFEPMAAEYMDIYHADSTQCPLQPESCETLAALQRAGLRQVLLSASLQSHLEMQTARYPLAGYFEKLLGIGDIYATSKALLARRFVEGCGVDPQQILFVGDSVHDHEVAADCGCRCVLYDGGHQNSTLLAATGAPVIHRLSALPCYCLPGGAH